ncbi:MAG: class I SAM-dependent methyltransferase [Lentisphaerae bacterium]|nr:class I SAM-dependent methyltransferase [Lentisphaerota bacterium]
MQPHNKTELLDIGRRIYPKVNNHIFSRDAFVENACDLCGSNRKKPVLLENEATLCRCLDCGLYYVSPRPSDKALAAYYEKYYDASEEEIAWWRFTTSKKFVVAAKFINKYAPTTRNCLDIGSGYGFFLQELNSQHAWQSCLGIDLDPRGVAYANACSEFPNVAYRNISVNDPTLEADSFDAISAQALLEHVVSPRQMLSRIYTLLKTNGIIYLTVPCEQVWIWLKHWIPAIPFRAMIPLHLYNFTRPTLERYFNSTGFFVEYVGITPSVRHADAMTHAVVQTSKWLAKILGGMTLGRWQSSIGGGLIVVGRKKERS